MPQVSTEDLKDDSRFPAMTRWFDPRLLCKLLLQVIVGGFFGRYADRRLVLAALDKVPDNELQQRADLNLSPDADGAIWFDYVSDLGDGFDATYAVAYLLAQESLSIGAETLPRGSLLIMGGDEVYPTSSRQDYNTRLRTPYQLAFPNRRDSPHPPVFMVPGNHDWYDGLVSFLALFCRQKPTRVGNWRTRQRRSYFAIKLKPDWWVWAIDIALTEDMDQPQADYFVAIASAMPQGAKIILCAAEPGWYEGAASFASLHYAAQLANNAEAADKTPKNFKIVAALSGDTHHYARYTSEFGTEFVTSGGGGAFLHGTHNLKETRDLRWLKEPNATLTLAARYPSKEESHKLLLGNLRFPFLNPEFAGLLGFVYWPLVYWMTMRPRVDTGIMVALILALGFCGYAAHQAIKKHKGLTLVMASAIAHAAVHLAAIWLLSRLFASLDMDWLRPRENSWRWLFLVGAGTVPVGGLIASFIFGLNLWITSRFCDINHNDAFSSMRLDSYRHFLRLRIKDNELTVYPVALDRVPARHEWRENADPAPGTVGSRFIPPEDVKPRLIEPAFTVRAREVDVVTETVTPQVLQGTTPTSPPPSAQDPAKPPSPPT